MTWTWQDIKGAANCVKEMKDNYNTWGLTGDALSIIKLYKWSLKLYDLNSTLQFQFASNKKPRLYCAVTCNASAQWPLYSCTVAQ